MWSWNMFCDPMWRPLSATLLHFVWQGILVAAAWKVLFWCCRGCRVQAQYVLGLAGLAVLMACPLVTFALLQSNARVNAVPTFPVGVAERPAFDLANVSASPSGSVPKLAAENVTPWRSILQQWADASQPYLIGGWIAGLAILSGRLLCGAIGARRLRRGRQPVSAKLVERAAVLARRLGLRTVPGVFVSDMTRDAVVTSLLRPMVLLPAAWLLEMTPEVLEAVIAHELAHIRRFDLWVNLFQRLVETILFYHPAVWWLSHGVRLAREMCCDELAVAVTGERMVYATALEFAAQRRLASARPLLAVALGDTRMTLLNRVSNVLGSADGENKGRWWPMVMLVLLVVLVSCFAVVLVGRGKYTADSFLRVSMQEKPLAFAGEGQLVDRDRFEIYKNTQSQLVTSRFVLLAALRNREMYKLPSVQAEQQKGDPVQWLQGMVKVTFPGNAELMRVSVTRNDPQEAMTVVRSVVDAFLTEVVNAERDQKMQRIVELDKACTGKETEIRCKREDLKRLAATLGTSDTETLSVQQKLALEELSASRQELKKSQFDLQRLQSELAAQQALLKGGDNVEIADGDEELELLVQKDPVALHLRENLAQLEVARLARNRAAGSEPDDAKQSQNDLELIQNQYNARRTELCGLIRKKHHKSIQRQIQLLETAITSMSEQVKNREVEVERQQKETNRFGTSTVDLEMLRTDIRNMDVILASLAQERERLKVESRSTPRITLLQRAEIPEVATWW